MSSNSGLDVTREWVWLELVANFLCHDFQRLQLPLINQVKLSHKVVEMFVARIDVGFGSHRGNPIKVVDVNMNKDAEKPSEYFLTELHEVSWKRNTNSGGEVHLIIDQCLNPVHEQMHILWSSHFGWPLILVFVLPPVFVFQPSWHDGTGPCCAKVTNSTIDEVDSIEEVYSVHCNPIVEVFPCRKLDYRLEINPRFKWSLSFLIQLKPLGSWLEPLPGSKCPIFIEDLFQAKSHLQRGVERNVSLLKTIQHRSNLLVLIMLTGRCIDSPLSSFSTAWCGKLNFWNSCLCIQSLHSASHWTVDSQQLTFSEQQSSKEYWFLCCTRIFGCCRNLQMWGIYIVKKSI